MSYFSDTDWDVDLDVTPLFLHFKILHQSSPDDFSIHYWELPKSVLLFMIAKQWFFSNYVLPSRFITWNSSLKKHFYSYIRIFLLPWFTIYVGKVEKLLNSFDIINYWLVYYLFLVLYTEFYFSVHPFYFKYNDKLVAFNIHVLIKFHLFFSFESHNVPSLVSDNSCEVLI